MLLRGLSDMEGSAWWLGFPLEFPKFSFTTILKKVTVKVTVMGALIFVRVIIFGRCRTQAGVLVYRFRSRLFFLAHLFFWRGFFFIFIGVCWAGRLWVATEVYHDRHFGRFSKSFFILDFLFVFLHSYAWYWLKEVVGIFISNLMDIKGLDVAFYHKFSLIHLIFHALMECGWDDIVDKTYWHWWCSTSVLCRVFRAVMAEWLSPLLVANVG